MGKRDISERVFSFQFAGEEQEFRYGKDLPFWDAEWFRRDSRLKSLRVWDNKVRTAERSYRENKKLSSSGHTIVRYVSLMPEGIFDQFVQTKVQTESPKPPQT